MSDLPFWSRAQLIRHRIARTWTPTGALTAAWPWQTVRGARPLATEAYAVCASGVRPETTAAAKTASGCTKITPGGQVPLFCPACPACKQKRGQNRLENYNAELRVEWIELYIVTNQILKQSLPAFQQISERLV